MREELRPMGIGDILDTTFRLYRRQFLTFLLIALVVYVPYALLTVLLQRSGLMFVVGEGAAPAHVNPVGFALGMLLNLIFVFFLIPLCGAALIENISASYLGDTLSAGESYGRALPRVLPLLGTQVLVSLIVVLGFLLLIVPGVIFSLWFFVIGPVVILERLGGSAALGRSRELMRGNLGKGFMLGLTVNILIIVVSTALNALGNFIPWPHVVLQQFFSIAVSAILLPVQTAPLILLYYDLRIRKEAFDLQRLSEVLRVADQSAAT